jgi:hypothetical protein
MTGELSVFSFIMTGAAEALLEDLIWLLIELVLELFGGAIFEGILEWLGRNRQELPNRSRLVILLGYALAGAIGGTISMAILRHPLLHRHITRELNLILTPPIVGALLVVYSKHSKHRWARVMKRDAFFAGTMFAFTFALVRYWFLPA